MRSNTLLDQTASGTGDITGSTTETYAYIAKGTNASTSGVATFDLQAANVTATLQGSISGDSAEFVDIKAVSRSGTNILEGHTVAIFPYMRVKCTSVTDAAEIKVMIAYP
jgi:hypothetical protein